MHYIAELPLRAGLIHCIAELPLRAGLIWTS